MSLVKGARPLRYVLPFAVALGLLSTACSTNPDPVTNNAIADNAIAGSAADDSAVSEIAVSDIADNAIDEIADAADTAASETADTADAADTPDAAAAATDGVNNDGAPVPDAVSEEDLARFVAASESAVADSSVAGVVLDAPEIYIAIAQASCARFTQGHTLDQIVGDHLDSTSASSADDEQLIGAVLGATVETICPEHSDKL